MSNVSVATSVENRMNAISMYVIYSLAEPL